MKINIICSETGEIRQVNGDTAKSLIAKMKRQIAKLSGVAVSFETEEIENSTKFDTFDEVKKFIRKSFNA